MVEILSPEFCQNALGAKHLRELDKVKTKAQISNAQPNDPISYFHLKSPNVVKSQACSLFIYIYIYISITVALP